MNWLLSTALPKPISCTIFSKNVLLQSTKSHFPRNFSDIQQFFETFNTHLGASLSPERIEIISKMPAYSLIFDMRVIVSIVGIIAVALYFVKPSNKYMQIIRVNIRPLAFTLLYMKYTLSIICLLISPATFFSFSNLFFGFSSWHLFFLAIDILIYFSLLQINHLDKHVVYDEPKNIINNCFEYFRELFNGISVRKTIIFFLVGILLTLVGKLTGIHGGKISEFFTRITPDLLLRFFNSYIQPLFFCLFVAPHYSFTGYIDRMVDASFQYVIDKNIRLLSTITRKTQFILKLIVNMFINQIYGFIMAQIMVFYCYMCSAFTFFRKTAMNQYKEDEYENV